MLTVTKEFGFDAAHILEGHDGLCSNLHGHTYKVMVEVCHRNETIERGASKGMVIDFKHLKESLNEVLFGKLDHALIGYRDPDSITESTLLDAAEKLELRTYIMPLRPTAENMCIHFSDVIKKVLAEHFIGLRLMSITVYETPTSYATINCGGIV